MSSIDLTETDSLEVDFNKDLDLDCAIDTSLFVKGAASLLLEFVFLFT